MRRLCKQPIPPSHRVSNNDKLTNIVGCSKKRPSKSHISSRSPSPAPANKLEELLPPVLNRLTPSNIKRTAADFMKEWERSLSPPDMMSATAAATMGKEKGT